jgi:Protein of unknown function (DUF2490)
VLRVQLHWQRLRGLRRAALVACFAGALLAPKPGSAQGAMWEAWPEVDVSVQTASRWRAGFITRGQIADSAARSQLLLGLHGDYLFPPLGYVSAGYRHYHSYGGKASENRLLTDVTLNKGLPDSFRFVNRAQIDFRWIGGDFSTRLRERMRLERLLHIDAGQTALPYVMSEVFYDTHVHAISRLRTTIGAELAPSSRGSVDVGYFRQDEYHSDTPDANVVQVILRLHY